MRLVLCAPILDEGKLTLLLGWSIFVEWVNFYILYTCLACWPQLCPVSPPGTRSTSPSSSWGCPPPHLKGVMSRSGNFITKLYYGIPGKFNEVVRLKLRFLSIILFFFFFIFYCVLARLTDVVWWVDGVLALQDTLQLLLTHMHPAVLIPVTQVRGMLELSMLSRFSPGVQA